MDAYLAVVAKREIRTYADRRIPEEVVERLLEAGRVTGSSMNRQPWRFLALESREIRDSVADTVYQPSNLRGAPLAVAIVVTGGATADFDAGRAAQSMMLAALNDGVGSCPNGVADRPRFADLIPLAEGERPAIVLSFGFPAGAYRPEDHSPREWIRRARRKPPSEVISRL